ncbi:MAG: hypothetical protein AABX23_05050 [Nanoarchaeota archaeon]
MGKRLGNGAVRVSLVRRDSCGLYPVINLLEIAGRIPFFDDRSCIPFKPRERDEFRYNYRKPDSSKYFSDQKQ